MKISQLAFLAAFAAGSASAFTAAPSNRVVFGSVDTALAGRRRAGGAKRSTGLKSRGKVSYTPGSAAPAVDEEEVRALFSLWNNALATGDSRIVAKRYAKQSILLPTVSDVPRTDFASIKDYFDAFLQKEPQGKILEGDIRIGEGWAQDAGIYEVRTTIHCSCLSWNGRLSVFAHREILLSKQHHTCT